MLGVLGEAQPGVEHDPLLGDPLRQRRRHPLGELRRAPRSRRRRTRRRLSMSWRWPRQCITTYGTPAAATTGASPGSARPPQTSLTSRAPAATAASATSARMVSTLTMTPGRGQLAGPPGRPGAAPRSATPARRRAGWTRRRRRRCRRPAATSVETVGDGACRVEPPPAVGERVGRDVHHAHHEARADSGSRPQV